MWLFRKHDGARRKLAGSKPHMDDGVLIDVWNVTGRVSQTALIPKGFYGGLSTPMA
jgi:hypothetical protein